MSNEFRCENHKLDIVCRECVKSLQKRYSVILNHCQIIAKMHTYSVANCHDLCERTRTILEMIGEYKRLEESK